MSRREPRCGDCRKWNPRLSDTVGTCPKHDRPVLALEAVCDAYEWSPMEPQKTLEDEAKERDPA